ncbi:MULTISPECIES: ATP-dependent protease ATPase subunit HslU [Leptospira]|uniref:ATP-dependent protease ATPase subunit HslU n=1 Tax=Leptospira borgpetersenii serovar Ballum TaxID=280505 RepID=A0A0E3B0R5_LEPBO|nr:MULTISPECIES: ATP-dependent protease ATPase subunit HslU [Leptospira]ALO25751.1 ATP-dependent protease [Leptospira borgpetersenii serovar Ballum]ANH00578.2 ATP-dependent protease ATPase subunit HslU [Leptospira borgpetersenii str. 4E]AXX16023.1 ATP-dependent protease ATPase subunit HslU [Leptospira borgpetersenii serovar Ceylonica]KGE23886.1 ATP-dependent protease [Leptospira borgpetersenii serovar Ballum]MBE8159922.1 ATP-dependent protease ATPase subunit HslU [Leptospira borgpetersenii ser
MTDYSKDQDLMLPIEEELTPRQIVTKLDEHIIGQKNAKKAVAIALRNRTRRKKLDLEMREEIYPKNIIMIGPTGVGKTEIARRLSKLCGAPFLKVEATKYTEVGYVGRDVESMIRDLAVISMNLVKQEFRTKVEETAKQKAEEALLDILLPFPVENKYNPGQAADFKTSSTDEEERKTHFFETREFMRKKLKTGKLDDQEVELDLPNPSVSQIPMLQVFGAGNLDDLDNQLQNVLGDLLPKKNKKRKLKIPEAIKTLEEFEADKLLDPDKVQREALRRVEEMGIIFLDEIDKIAGREGKNGADVSREGVQRDLLPIVEGATVNTKIGPVKTDHILFIAAGAFHMTKPSDLIPELQGRFPIRVELEKLSREDFEKILTAPRSSLTRQYEALLFTDGIQLEFSSDGIQEIARIAYDMNEKHENIGARRLNTILERLLEEVSFEGPDLPENQKNIKIDGKYVMDRLQGVIQDKDLSQYIL